MLSTIRAMELCPRLGPGSSRRPDLRLWESAVWWSEVQLGDVQVAAADHDSGDAVELDAAFQQCRERCGGRGFHGELGARHDEPRRCEQRVLTDPYDVVDVLLDDREVASTAD